jgi:hypothetical protein
VTSFTFIRWQRLMNGPSGTHMSLELAPHPGAPEMKSTGMKDTSAALSRAEFVRRPDEECEPDPCAVAFAGRTAQPLVLHHAEIAAIELKAAVPQAIAI